jgi:hypothetical protein
MNRDHVQKLVAVGVGRQQRREHRGAAFDKPARHVVPVAASAGSRRQPVRPLLRRYNDDGDAASPSNVQRMRRPSSRAARARASISVEPSAWPKASRVPLPRIRNGGLPGEVLPPMSAAYHA